MLELKNLTFQVDEEGNEKEIIHDLSLTGSVGFFDGSS